MRFLKASPETFDGQTSWIIHPRDLGGSEAKGVVDALKLFMDESAVGDVATFTVIEMSEAEYERLPEP